MHCNATSSGASKATWAKRVNDGNNNDQAPHGARKHAWRTQAAWAKILNITEINLYV